MGIGEDSHALKARGLNEIQQRLETTFGFSREPHDESRADGNPGNSLSDAFEQFLDIVTAGFTPHAFEHGRVDMLQGDVDIFGDLIAGGDSSDKLIRPVSRVSV